MVASIEGKEYQILLPSRLAALKPQEREREREAFVVAFDEAADESSATAAGADAMGGGGGGVAGRWGPGVRMTVDLGWWWVVGDLRDMRCKKRRYWFGRLKILRN